MNKQGTKRRSYKAWTVVLIGMAGITCLLVEGTLRAWEAWTHGVPFWSNNANPNYVEDAELGWKPRPNRNQATLGSGAYAGIYSTDEDGMRPGWNIGSPNGKLLILGDSFTHGVDVPDPALYTHWLARGLDMEVRAFAAEGYGTAQSLIVLKRLRDRFEPDWIVLQCAANDFINHHPRLESKSLINNSLRPRPYYELASGKYRVLKPRDPLAGSFAPWVKYSRLARRAFMGILVYREKWNHLPETVEARIIREQDQHSGFIESIEITRAIMDDLKATARPARLLVFSADHVLPFTEKWDDITENLDIPYFPGIPKVLGNYSTGRSHFTQDGVHWSPQGHHKVAETLGPWLAQQTNREWNPDFHP